MTAPPLPTPSSLWKLARELGPGGGVLRRFRKPWRATLSSECGAVLREGGGWGRRERPRAALPCAWGWSPGQVRRAEETRGYRGAFEYSESTLTDTRCQSVYFMSSRLVPPDSRGGGVSCSNYASVQQYVANVGNNDSFPPQVFYDLFIGFLREERII